MNSIVILLGILGSVYSNYAETVPLVTKCQASDSSCIKQSAQALLPLLAEGRVSPDLKLLDPLQIVKIDASKQTLKLIAHNVVVKGLKECTIDSITRDAVKSKMNVDLLCTVVVEGDYDIKGKILVLPLDGRGRLIISLTKILISVDIDLDEIEKGSKKHWNIKHWDVSYIIKQKANIELTNLFNGSPELTQAIRDVLGASANELVQELGPPVVKAIAAEVVATVNGFFQLVPVEDLALN